MAISLYYFSNKERKRIDRLEVFAFLCLVIFLVNQSKNKVVLEPRTGHFRGLVGFEARAKDFKMCSRCLGRPRGQGCSRGLHLRFLCFEYIL